MARVNVSASYPPQRTHEGGPAVRQTALQELRRAVLSCLLWEGSFYESGEAIAARICGLCSKVRPEEISALAIEARSRFKLRHAPLLLARELAKVARGEQYAGLTSSTLFEIIQRPDELHEFLALYWQKGRVPLSAQVKKGLALAFGKFSEYALAKWRGDGAVKLRDVLFLSHAKATEERQDLYRRLAKNELETPDTWEVALSAGANKRETFERLISEKKLGALALLRNLRGMREAGVPMGTIEAALERMDVERVLPYRFITAARYAPMLEPALEAAMFKAISGMEKIPGKTLLLVDVSGSMDDKVSQKGETTRMDAACGLAILARELCEHVIVLTFSSATVFVPPRRGFALRDAIVSSQPHGATYLGEALRKIKGDVTAKSADRIIVFTDEQAHDEVGEPIGRGYIANVSPYEHSVGYGPWTRINGFSESMLSYVLECEREP